MKNIQICLPAAIVIISITLVISGCNEPNGTARSISAEKENAVILALKFTPGDSTTYRVTTETTRKAVWEGMDERKPTGFKGGQSGNKIEITFNQNILSTNENGNAVAEITIEKLKYLTKIADNIVLDFDSSRESDRQNSLSRLIGQRYKIEFTPFGQIKKGYNTDSIQAAFMAATAQNKLANRLLSEDAITQRHSIPALPAGDKTQFNIGESWEVVKDISYDQMGVKSFGKTYTLEDIEDRNNSRIAVVRMNAIPSAKHAKELYQTQTTLSFPHDSTDTYSGRLKLDLLGGKIEEYNEKLTTEWIIIDPASKNKERPDSIRMSETRSYSIERID